MTPTRLFAAVAALALASTIVAGCGNDDTGSQEGGKQKLTGRGPIKWATGKDSTGTYATLVKKWNAAHPDEKVTLAELPAEPDQAREQLVQNAEIKSGEYDVLGLDVTWATEFAAKRYVVELPKGQFDTKPFLPATVQSGSYRKKLYAAPVFSGAAFLYYRTDLLQKAGVKSPPKTWAQMKSACGKVLKLPAAKGMDCYAGQHKENEGLTVNFSEAVHGAGGQVVDKNGKPTVNTPQARKGLDFLVDGFQSKMIPKVALTYDEETGRAAFQKGKFVFHRSWPYLWEPLNATDGSSKVAGKFQVTTIPGQDGPGTSMLGGTDLAISSYTKNKATALDFIKYMTAAKTQRVSATKGALPPTRKSLYSDDSLKKKLPYLEQLHAALLDAKPRPQVINYAGVSSAISDDVYAAQDGSKKPDEALRHLQSKLTKVTKNQP